MESDLVKKMVRGLERSAAYPHMVGNVKLLETHISWVFLTGDFAYKVKKPVDLGYLDYTSLEKRYYYCEMEVRLNKLIAPEIYIGVVPITGVPECPMVEGNGPVIEYAVKMKEFPQKDILNLALARGEVPPSALDSFARDVAHFHANAPTPRLGASFGSPETIKETTTQNFIKLLEASDFSKYKERVNTLFSITEKEFSLRVDDFENRRDNGFIREVHGDMHTGNMAFIDGKIIMFDRIEFNEPFRWIDVMSDTAFLVMDLMDRGYSGLSRKFLDSYLSASGDYEGISVLRFYLSYRAMVRAKVALIRGGQVDCDTQEDEALKREFEQYLAMAERYMKPAKPILIITHGVAGCGKSTFAKLLIEETGAIVLRSDIERKRMFGMGSDEKRAEEIEEGLYAPEAIRKTYSRLETLAGFIISAGFPVIVDATFLKHSWRDRFKHIAQERGVPFMILDIQAPKAVLRNRVAKREFEGLDASDASLMVLEKQLMMDDGLMEDELAETVVVDSLHMADSVKEAVLEIEKVTGDVLVEG
ncbi:FIG00496272: hypothetical protein [hydrothermal vent metagenome]|uniref:Aminoglycoside phosphotransferase domain-containing protein n=1 Tax=hydrothermal vent metagenome TaxID=652676 RepID=A0A3B1CYQ9_9ZZZZ